MWVHSLVVKSVTVVKLVSCLTVRLLALRFDGRISTISDNPRGIRSETYE